MKTRGYLPFTIGADVEVFGKQPEGSFVALCGKVGGTKESPKQVPEFPAGCMVQEDNVAMEFNIPPSRQNVDFLYYMCTMRDHCKATMKSLTLELSETSSVSFPVDQLVHPKAKEFGCDPDYSAWTKEMNQPPEPEDKTLRTCGGHIHVGTNKVDMVAGIRAMDLFLGVPSVLIDTSEASRKRRLMYGKAGAMRPKPYGFEYRVLSNFWMFEDYLIEWVFENTRLALLNTELASTHSVGEKIQKCINEDDKVLAEELVKEFGIPLPNKNNVVKKKEAHFFWGGADPVIRNLHTIDVDPDEEFNARPAPAFYNPTNIPAQEDEED